MDLNGIWSEVTSILVVYCTATSDTDICHFTNVLDIMFGG